MNEKLLGETGSPFESRERIREYGRRVGRLWRRQMGLKENGLVSLLVSVVAGVAITLISGLFRAPLSRIGVDVVSRGSPVPWIIQVIPRAGHVLWVQLIADAVFWAAVSFAAVTIVMHYGTTRTVQHYISRRG
jgi:hypothetical protein